MDYFSGVFGSVPDRALDALDALFNPVDSAADFWEGLVGLVTDPKGTGQAIQESTRDMADAAQKGNLKPAGEFMGGQAVSTITGISSGVWLAGKWISDPSKLTIEQQSGVLREADTPPIVRSDGGADAVSGSKLNSQLIAQEVAYGHAFDKHGAEFSSVGVRTKNQFFSFIEDIVSNPATEVRYAKDGTAYYLDYSTRTVVIRGRRGEATAFRPDYGSQAVGWDKYLESQVPNNRK